MRSLFLILVAIVAWGCEGAVGPVGPEGPQGPTGRQGPGTSSYFYSGQINATGSIGVALPPDLGTITRLPQASCYVAQERTGPYFMISWDPASTIFCGFRQNEIGQLTVFIASPSPTATAPAPFAGWHYQIVLRPQNPSS